MFFGPYEIMDSSTLDITMKYCTLMVPVPLQRLDVLIMLSIWEDKESTEFIF